MEKVRADTAPGSAWARGPLKPLRHRQYRRLAASMVLELTAAGSWLVAIVWLIIEHGGGPTQLSIVTTGSAIGLLATALLGGVAADRVPQRTILLLTTLVRIVVVAVVGALAFADAVPIPALAAAALVIGASEGFYFPAYSALLPALVHDEDLLAANGLEGFLRPTLLQAAGPALAGVVVAATSPAVAIAMTLVLEVLVLLPLLALRPVALGRDLDAEPTSAWADIKGGLAYMLGTPWFLATLLFACLLVLAVIGPLEVLVPFVVKDRAGGGPTDHALVLAAFGIGGAIAALVAGASRLPRRYLTVMVGLWGVSCVPMLAVGFSESVVVIAAAMFVVGALFEWPTVIWGTLLQRRVPREMLGRASSLDFFVSLLLMPVSMALAGPLSQLIGLQATFVLVAVVPLVAAPVAIWAARMPRDEIAHPLRAETSDT